ncbi:gas vesicle protein GvpJ [Pseudonocardia kujensis]|uniref:gas vesicle protein GvpJ n=1 Tax=Pseudonocardia kujensis TaxID=1128675 RepID=UPI00355740E7
MTTTRPAGPPVVRHRGDSNLADVVDLILDRGMVIDVFVRVSLLGLEILTLDIRIVVASVDTFLQYAEATDRLYLYGTTRAERLPAAAGAGHSAGHDAEDEG